MQVLLSGSAQDTLSRLDPDVRDEVEQRLRQFSSSEPPGCVVPMRFSVHGARVEAAFIVSDGMLVLRDLWVTEG